MGLTQIEMPALQRSHSSHETPSDRSDRQPIHAGTQVPVLELLWMERQHAPCACSPPASIRPDAHEALSQGSARSVRRHEACTSQSGSRLVRQGDPCCSRRLAKLHVPQRTEPRLLPKGDFALYRAARGAPVGRGTEERCTPRHLGTSTWKGHTQRNPGFGRCLRSGSTRQRRLAGGRGNQFASSRFYSSVWRPVALDLNSYAPGPAT